MTDEEMDRLVDRVRGDGYTYDEVERDIRAALRQAADEALERAARRIEWLGHPRASINAAAIRALLASSPEAPPAKAEGHWHPGETGRCYCDAPPSEPAAPAAEPDRVSRLLGRGHVENPREGEPGDAETPSEPVAPAPSAAEKRIAELEAVLHECEDNIRRKGHTGEWAKDCKECALFLRISARTASPAAQGKETRK